jgi:tetratricopeptide (TPR) repeat protein
MARSTKQAAKTKVSRAKSVTAGKRTPAAKPAKRSSPSRKAAKAAAASGTAKTAAAGTGKAAKAKKKAAKAPAKPKTTRVTASAKKAAAPKKAPEKPAAKSAKKSKKAATSSKRKPAQASASSASLSPAKPALRPAKITVRHAPPPPPPPPVDKQAEQAAKVERQLGLRQAEHYEKAVAMFNARKYSRAHTLLEKAVEGPDLTIRHRAQVYAEICRRQIGHEKLQLKTAEDHYNYAVKLMNDRRFDDARQHLQRALQMAPKAGYVHYANAVLSALQGDAESAFGNLKKAIEIDPLNRVLALNDADLAAVASHPPIVHLLSEGGGH